MKMGNIDRAVEDLIKGGREGREPFALSAPNIDTEFTTLLR